MGMMTTITILNDGFSDIKENKEEFINNIEKGMNGETFLDKNNICFKKINYYPVGNHCNPMIVSTSHHADMPRLYLVGRNAMNIIGENDDYENKFLEERKRNLEIAKRLIKQEENIIKELENNRK